EAIMSRGVKSGVAGIGFAIGILLAMPKAARAQSGRLPLAPPRKKGIESRRARPAPQPPAIEIPNAVRYDAATLNAARSTLCFE
ncbi:MAG TPA: hypothetical protein VL523_01795, partial [Terriglobia bacterium]|nr:hypothetical protein [Terriglobia bacterium]